MKVRALLGLMVLATVVLAGCDHYVCSGGATFGNTTCSSSNPNLGGGIGTTAFVYAMDDKAGQIAAEGLDVNNSGTFEPIPNFVPPSLPMKPVLDGGIVIVNKTYLYVPFSNGTVYGFKIDATSGALTATPNSPYAVAGGLSITADPAGKFVFVGDFTGISAFTVNTDGSLTVVPNSPFPSSIALQMVTDGLGKYLYSVDGTSINAFSYNSTTGALTAVGSFATGLSMSNIAGEITGQFIVGVTGQTGASGVSDDHIYVFGITQSGATAGALAQVGGSPFSTINPPAFVAVSPNGSFVYAFTQTAIPASVTLDPIEGYALSSTGTLMPLSTSPFSTLLGEIGKFDQTGQFLFTIGQETTSANAGMIAIGASTTTGALIANLPAAGSVSTSFAVTDAP